MKSKKATVMLTEEIIKIVLFIIASLVLITLAVIGYQFFSINDEVKRAQTDLNSISEQLKTLSTENPNLEMDLLQTPTWNILTKNNNDGNCGNSFCLCLCTKKVLCDDKKLSCTSVDKLSLIKQNNKIDRFGSLEVIPRRINLTFTNQTVYSYLPKPESKSIYSRTSPIYFSFKENEWHWSFNTIKWTPSSELGIDREGSPYYIPDKKLRDFVKYVIDRKSEQEGKNRLNKVATESKGVYIIEI